MGKEREEERGLVHHGPRQPRPIAAEVGACPRQPEPGLNTAMSKRKV